MSWPRERTTAGRPRDRRSGASSRASPSDRSMPARMVRTDWLEPLLLDTARPRSAEGGMLRFVQDEDYAGSFGREWNWFSTTQLDRVDNESLTTFVQKTGVSPEKLEGKTVLDAGCGMGRFADVVSAHGAKVVGIDLSAAVDAAQRNLGGRENVAIMQASLFDL